MGIEEKIIKLKEIVSKYESEEFLTLISGILLQMPTRKDNPFLQKLMSPMRQLFFLGHLHLERNQTGDKKGIDENEWDEIATLLHEIEIAYFLMLGFPKSGNESDEEIEKIKVTMPTFMNYYFNGPLSYQEQEIEKLEQIFKGFENKIMEDFGLPIADFVSFFDTLSNQVNTNLNKAIQFMNPERWQAFTDSCIAKGIMDPKDWIAEAPEEIYGYVNFMRNPGSILQMDLNKIEYIGITKENFIKILDIFTCAPTPKQDISYYTEENMLMNKPFIRLSENLFLSFFTKQFLNACFNHLFSHFQTINADKIFKARDQFVERKTESILKKVFDRNAFFYTNYSIDNGASEQDILILYKSVAVVVEIKAAGYRAPMRDAQKAYDKLTTDFKKNIQAAYDQGFRVSKAFESNDKVKICDMNKKLLYEVSTKKYRVFKIIVTLERFGHIQTNLSDMLVLCEGDEFPWAVCLDDLEAFVLSLCKRTSKIQSFLTFLEYREHFHDHLLCGDELELCGLFLSNEEKFKRYSTKEEIISTDADLTTPIEKIYLEGMGFDNERFIAEKKDKHTAYLYSDKPLKN